MGRPVLGPGELGVYVCFFQHRTTLRCAGWCRRSEHTAVKGWSTAWETSPLGLLGLTGCPGKGSEGPGFSLGSDFLLGDLGQVVWGWLRWNHPEQVLYPHELTESSKQPCEEGTAILSILRMQKLRSSMVKKLAWSSIGEGWTPDSHPARLTSGS